MSHRPTTWARCAAGLLALCLSLPGGLSAQEPDPVQLEAAATAGDVAAQLALGELYHEGAGGLMQNFATAARWYARAAEAGDPGAQNRLGGYYHSGLGVARDRATALQWLEAAAAQGAPEHLFDLARVLEQDRDDPAALRRAATLYERAAQAGYQEAAVNLGVLYQNGIGVAQDHDRARQLYEAPAAAGHARAQNNLGLLYVRGTGVAQDYDRAAQLFAAAAEQGLPVALTNLGVMYENGFGVAQSDAEAARLYRLAGGDDGTGAAEAPAEATRGLVYDARLLPPPSDQSGLRQLESAARAGDPVAQFQLGWVLVQAEAPSFDDWRNAAALFRAAADKGHAVSMANLGLLYMAGKGLPQDFVLGQMWILLAGSAGLPEAGALGAAHQAVMTPGQINEAQTLAEARRKTFPGGAN